MRSGVRADRSTRRTCSCSSGSFAPARGRSTTAATTRSPHSTSGTPTTAASATSGCSMSTASISPGDRFSPPRTITSCGAALDVEETVGVEPAGVARAEPAVLVRRSRSDVLAGHLLAPNPYLADLAGGHRLAERVADGQLDAGK